MNIKTNTSFPGLKSIITSTLVYDTDSFTCNIYPNPHRYISKTNSVYIDSKEDKDHKNKITNRTIDIHDDIHKAIKSSILKNREIQHLLKLFSNNMKDGKPCLDITPDSVLNNIVRREYLAYIRITNNDHDDYAIGALQYKNWCTKDDEGPKQLWIHALCRIQNPQIKKNNPDIKLKSPLSVLFDVVRDFSLHYSIKENYLIVDNYAKTGANKLLEIYNNYGFKRDDTCNAIPNYEHIEHNGKIISTSAIVMKKSIIPPAAAANNNSMSVAAANHSMPHPTSYKNIHITMNDVNMNNKRANNTHANNRHVNNRHMNNFSGGKRTTRKTKKK